MRIEIRADPSELASLRRRLVRCVRSAGDAAAVADDIALASSELATNVMRYTDTDVVEIALERDESTWVLAAAGVGR